VTFHATSRRPRIQGSARSNALGHRLSPRLAVSFTAVEFARLAALAERLGVPAATVVRRAVAAYTRRHFPEPKGGESDENPVPANHPNQPGSH
jgi:hypothetical protein